MKVIQMTMDAELLQRVDQCVKRLGTTRSAFAREALQVALQNHDEAELEMRHRAGYRRVPPVPQEFAILEQDRAWGYDPWGAAEAPR